MSKDRHPLHPLLADIQGKIGRIREDLEKIRGAVTKIQEILERGIEDIHDAIYDSIEAQAELKMMERMAEVHSIPPQIEAEQQRIDQEREEINEKLDGVSQRYERKHNELDQKATERVRNLGEHIFAVLEGEFEDGIETPFIDALTPTWEELQEHNTRVAADRRMRLREELGLANTKIDSFLERRETLLNDIYDHRLSMDTSITEPMTLQVPFWVVTTECDGEEETTIVGPSHLSDADDDGRWFTAHVDPVDGFGEPIEQFARTEPGQTRKVDMTPDELIEVADSYAADRLGGSLSFTTELQRAVSDNPEIRVEGVPTDG